MAVKLWGVCLFLFIFTTGIFHCPLFSPAQVKKKKETKSSKINTRNEGNETKKKK